MKARSDLILVLFASAVYNCVVYTGVYAQYHLLNAERDAGNSSGAWTAV